MPSEQKTPDPFALAADLFDPPKTGAVRYRDDPAGFLRDCFEWKDGEGPTHYQLRNIELLCEKKRAAVRGPHGLGKTTTNAWTALWFAVTRDAGGEDWKVITTASAWRQLEKYLWPEIHKWTKRLKWDVLGRPPFNSRELMTLSLKLRSGEAFAAACEDPAKIEGAHADQLLFIYDEAKAVPARTFDASEGAFSGAGGDTKHDAFALASSTPGPPTGRFYDIHRQAPGLEDWTPIHVTLDDVIEAGRVSKQWADQRRAQWGATSAVYLNRVKGEFCASEEDGVIPLAWVEAAMERWHDLPDEINLDETPLTIGADIARSGTDRTVLALRYGYAVREIRRLPRQGTMETAGQINGILHAHHHPARSSTAVIDVIGIGAGVVDRLREISPEKIEAFAASEGTMRRDRSGELGFVNTRAAAYWNLRDLLDPDNHMELALPPDDELLGDLTAPKWKVMSGGKIQLESKDDLRKRIGRSTDCGDAVTMAYWPASGMVEHLMSFATSQDADFFASAPQGSRWTFDSSPAF